MGICLMPIYFFSTIRNESNCAHITGNRDYICNDRCASTGKRRQYAHTHHQCRSQHNSAQALRIRQPYEQDSPHRNDVVYKSNKSSKQTIRQNSYSHHKGIHGITRLRTHRQAELQNAIGKGRYNFQKQIPIERRKRQRHVFHPPDAIHWQQKHDLDYSRFSRVHKQTNRRSRKKQHAEHGRKGMNKKFKV